MHEYERVSVKIVWLRLQLLLAIERRRAAFCASCQGFLINESRSRASGKKSRDRNSGAYA
jgi:hypothetical protein